MRMRQSHSRALAQQLQLSPVANVAAGMWAGTGNSLPELCCIATAWQLWSSCRRLSSQLRNHLELHLVWRCWLASVLLRACAARSAVEPWQQLVPCCARTLLDNVLR